MIQDILDFINEYYHVFILILLIGTFLVSSLKNNNIVNNKKDIDFVRVFDMVNKAEQLFPESGSGAIKLSYVISQLKDIEPDKVINLVDEILSSPEKK